jgi:hypothetical protein
LGTSLNSKINQIIKISNKEQEFIENANIKYHQYYQTAVKSLCLIENLVLNSLNNKNLKVINHFLPNVYHDFLLAIMANVRNHIIPCSFLLRHSIENTVLACYGFEDNNIINYGYDESNNTYNLNFKINKTANNWIKNKYPVYSNLLKLQKDIINKFNSHSNIITLTNLKIFEDSYINDKQYETQFKDANDELDLICKGGLMTISILCLIIISTIININKDYKILIIDDNLENLVMMHMKKVVKLYDKLFQIPKFKQIYDEIEKIKNYNFNQNN